MGLTDRFRRRRRKGATGGGLRRGGSDAEVRAHLETFIGTRRGVEGFVEPPTAVAEVTLLLVAHDGEWTRRQVPSERWAHDFCNSQRVPSYDAGLVGVPRRMREYNRRKRQQRGW